MFWGFVTDILSSVWEWSEEVDWCFEDFYRHFIISMEVVRRSWLMFWGLVTDILSSVWEWSEEVDWCFEDFYRHFIINMGVVKRSWLSFEDLLQTFNHQYGSGQKKMIDVLRTCIDILSSVWEWSEEVDWCLWTCYRHLSSVWERLLFIISMGEIIIYHKYGRDDYLVSPVIILL
jgi:hypothetical protein